MGTESWVYMSDEIGSWDEIAVYSIKPVKSGLLTISDNRIQYQNFPSTNIYAQKV